MSNNILLQTLFELGLEENEARVYLAGLKLGPTTVLKLSQESEVKRTTIYSVLENLKEKGLSKIETNGWKKYFVMSDPQQLLLLLDQKKQKLQKILPQFEAVYNLPETTSLIQYYETKQGIRNAYKDILSSTLEGDDYLIVSNLENWYNLDPLFFEDFITERAKYNLKIRALFTQDNKLKSHLQNQKSYNMQIKALPKSTTLNTNLVITPQKVFMHQILSSVGLVITNPDIIKMHREIFEILWRDRI